MQQEAAPYPYLTARSTTLQSIANVLINKYTNIQNKWLAPSRYLLLADIKATFRGDPHLYSYFKDEDSEAQRNDFSSLWSASSGDAARNRAQAHVNN